MTRILRTLGMILAVTTAGLGIGAFSSTSGAPAAAQSGGFTPLPPGWELCILEGLSAPATAANVSDLDEWQAAEGGSTNNTAAFNPYNTLRMTDVTGTKLPGATSANGFPAFPTWAAGCAATVATLFQPNMWVITEALRAGNVAPPGAFLAVVDQSSWCAPTNGVPCYVDAIESTPGSLVLAVPGSSALTVYGSVNSDLQSYQQSIAVVTNDQNEVANRNVALAASESGVEKAQTLFGAASHALQGFAVNEYVSTGLYSSAPLVAGPETTPLGPRTPQSSDGVVAQQYIHLTASHLVAKSDAAAAALKASEQKRTEAADAVAKAAITLTSDETAESQDLLQLMTDFGTLEHAGACTTVTITLPPAVASAVAGTTSTTSTTIPTSTTTTSVPPATTSTTSTPTTSTTTTTVPPTTTTTDPVGAPTTTTPTTTTVPPTTTTTTTSTTTTVPPTTTTTTTVPLASAAPSSVAAPPGEAPGVSALQGCIAGFAPPASA